MDLNLLIELVKDRPVLYDRTYLQVDYSSAMRAKEKHWKVIAVQMGYEDVAAVKKKWKMLRDTFLRFLKKIHLSDAETLEVSWPHFQKLIFLKDYCKINEDPKEVNQSLKKLVDNTIKDEQEHTFHNESYTYELLDNCNSNNSNKNEQIPENDEPEMRYLESTESYVNDEEIIDITIPTRSSSTDDRKGVKRKAEDFDFEKLLKRKPEQISYRSINELDNEIAECLRIVKRKCESKKDHIDHFCSFISSYLKKWSDEDQGEAIKFLTSYFVEKDISINRRNK